MTRGRPAGSHVESLPAARPPAWLILATGLLGAAILAMAVAETNLWMHYLIDAGESISLVGLGFMLLAGIYLYRQRRLLVSLPLALPWLLFPVITQGDQIIDNLSIGWMQFVCHVLLAAIFGTPVAIVVLAVRYAIAPRGTAAVPPAARLWAIVPGVRQLAEGRVREGAGILAAMLLALEIWVAVRFLGTLMVVTLLVMIWGALVYGSWPDDPGTAAARRQRSERFALWLLVGGTVLSLALFFGYKNRPGAYQGSPSYFMDPSQRDAGFHLDRVPVPGAAPKLPASPDAVRAVLVGYASALERLLSGYYILDRNYNYDFHNHLFLRSTPLLPEYRTAGLRLAMEAQDLRTAADAQFAALRPMLDAGDPLTALVDDVNAYTTFTFGRTPVLERMSFEFQKTDAGLQHATHLYEGEGKVLGVELNAILDKHRAVIASPALAPVTAEFVTISRRVYDKYANRIVGF